MPTGKEAEDFAAQDYVERGFVILDRNFSITSGKQIGELDIVCRKDDEIVFVEVKLRNTETFGTGFEAVDVAKQKKLVKMAKLYMQKKPEYSGLNYRIDLAWVTIDKGNKSVNILTNAIEDLD